MRPRTIAIAAVTVDGKIARGNSELVNWTSKEDKQFFRDETARIGIMIVGSKTFNTFPGPLPGRLHIVMTRDTKGKQNIEGAVEFTDKAPQDILDDLGKRGFKEVAIAGGSTIYSIFVKTKLLDELWVTIEPKIFGDGISLFKELHEANLILTHQRMLNQHSILLKYTLQY